MLIKVSGCLAKVTNAAGLRILSVSCVQSRIHNSFGFVVVPQYLSRCLLVLVVTVLSSLVPGVVSKLDQEMSGQVSSFLLFLVAHPVFALVAPTSTSAHPYPVGPSPLRPSSYRLR